MSTALTEIDEFTTAVFVPDDGDDFAAAGFKIGPQSLANRTRNLLNRRSLAYALIYTPISVSGVYESVQGGAGTGERVLLTQVAIPVAIGDVLLVQSSAYAEIGGGGGSATVLHKIKIAGAVAMQHRHVAPDAGAGNVASINMHATAHYIAVAAGTVDVSQAFQVPTTTSAPQLTAIPTYLSILKVRP